MAKIKSKMISLTYNFIFSKEANIWNNIYDFEHDLNDFFAAHGLECENITTVDGSSGGRMMLIDSIGDTSLGKLDNKDVNKATALNPAIPQKSGAMVKQMTSTLLKNLKTKGGKR